MQVYQPTYIELVPKILFTSNRTAEKAMNYAVINHKDELLALQKVTETLDLNTGMYSAVTGDFKNSYQ